MINKDYIEALMNTYSCNINKNIECNKRNCICNDGPCKRVSDFKYAKKTLLNYIKRIINKIRGYTDMNKSELKIEIDKDEALKDIRKVKKEVRQAVKECTFEINKLELKRRDILVIKVHSFFKANDMKRMKKELEKQLHRKVLLINDGIDIGHIISYRRK